jgi:hypothetical protein
VKRFFDAPLNLKQVPLAILRSPFYDDCDIEETDAVLKKHNVKNVTWLSPCVCALGYFNQSNGIVLDIGSLFVSFGIAWRGKEVRHGTSLEDKRPCFLMFFFSIPLSISFYRCDLSVCPSF